MLLNPKITKLLGQVLLYLSSQDREIMIEENPGLWVEARTADDEPEVQFRIDAETYKVEFRVDSAPWIEFPFLKLED